MCVCERERERERERELELCVSRTCIIIYQSYQSQHNTTGFRKSCLPPHPPPPPPTSHLTQRLHYFCLVCVCVCERERERELCVSRTCIIIYQSYQSQHNTTGFRRSCLPPLAPHPPTSHLTQRLHSFCLVCVCVCVRERERERERERALRFKDMYNYIPELSVTTQYNWV